jgi:branched-chain amino acid transport system substrate-binding protein
VGSYSNTVSEDGNPANFPKPIEAWASWVNSHGGINGHPIKLIVKDDTDSPVVAKAAYETLVEQDHVIAIVDTNDDGVNSGIGTFLAAHNVPVIGGANFTPMWNGFPFFNQGTGMPAQIYAQPGVAATILPAGTLKFAEVLCTEVAACHQVAPSFTEGAKLAGGKLVYLTFASETATDYTAVCIGAKNAGANAMGTGGINLPVLNEDCNRQNFHPIWVPPSTAFTPEQVAGVADAVTYTEDFPYYYKGPQTADFDAAMAAGGVDLTSGIGAYAAIAWVSGLMVQKAVQLSGVTGVPTSQDLINGLNKFNNETLGGLAPPLTFGNPRPDGGGIPCFFVDQSKYGVLSAPQGLKVTCVTVPPADYESPSA